MRLSCCVPLTCPVCLFAGKAGHGRGSSTSLCAFVCLPASVPPNFLFVFPCVHKHLSDLLLPILLPVSHSQCPRPQWGAAHPPSFSAGTVAFCHPSDGTSLPLSCENRPSCCDKLSPSAPQCLSSYVQGSILLSGLLRCSQHVAVHTQGQQPIR